MPHHCENKSDGFIWHGVEYVREHDAIAGAVIEPDYIDSLLDNAVAIWQRLSIVTVTESCVGFQRLRQVDVVTERPCSLACLKSVISLHEWCDLLLDGSMEARANAYELRTPSKYRHRQGSWMRAHNLLELSGRRDVGPSLGTCHRPNRLCPTQLLIRVRKCIPVAEEGPIGCLGYASDTHLLLVVCFVYGCGVSGSVGSRLYEWISAPSSSSAGRVRTLAI